MMMQDQNTVFQQWLAAYGNHLEQVAQGTVDSPAELDAQGKDGSTGPNDRPQGI